MRGLGKPHIPEEQFGSKVHINLSHSANLIACAISAAGRIGIDLEKVRPLQDLDGIATRFFSAPEYRLITLAEASEKLGLFYTIWTLKESFIKAVGKGLSMPLDNFWFKLPGGTLLEFHAEVCRASIVLSPSTESATATRSRLGFRRRISYSALRIAST